jgi:hypothetical protein
MARTRRATESPFSYGGERDRGARALRGEQERGPARATQIQGANPMLNPKNEPPAGANAQAERTRASARSNMRNTRGTATTGAATASNEQNRGPNFIGSGAKFKDNHP